MFYEKAFWMALVGVVVPLLNLFFGWGLDTGEVIAVVLPFVALILGVTWKEAEIEKAEIMLDIAMIECGLYEVETEDK